MSDKMDVQLRVNGAPYTANVEPRKTFSRPFQTPTKQYMRICFEQALRCVSGKLSKQQNCRRQH